MSNEFAIGLLGFAFGIVAGVRIVLYNPEVWKLKKVIENEK